jgi:hypothetical protein
MRKVICQSCSFSATEADREWDAISASGRCPKCSAPIQGQQFGAGIQMTNSQSSEAYSRQSVLGGNVVVTDIDMPFGSMVVFMVKWVLASIPAFIILLILFSIVSAFTGMGMGVLKH